MAKQSDNKKKVAHPEAKGLALIASSLFILLCLLSFCIGDPSKNWLGLVGHGVAFSFNYLFGLTSYCIPAFFLWAGWKLLSEEKIANFTTKCVYFSLWILSVCILLNLMAEKGLPFPSFLLNRVYSESLFFDLPYPHTSIRNNVGGVPAYFLYKDISTFNLHHMLSNVGVALTFSISAATSFLLTTEIRLLPLIKKGVEKIKLWQQALSDKRLNKDDIFTPAVALKQSVEEIEKTLTKSIPTPLYTKSIKNPEMNIRTNLEEEIEELPVKKEKIDLLSSMKKKASGNSSTKGLQRRLQWISNPPSLSSDKCKKSGSAAA